MGLIKKLGVKGRIWLLVATAFVVTLIVSVSAFWGMDEALMNANKLKSKQLVESAYSIVDGYVSQVSSGELTTEEAQKQAIHAIQHLRYGGGKEYFWVNDVNLKMVVHPLKPELNGTDISQIKDTNGKKFFVEMVDNVKKDGEGFVKYLWPKTPGAQPEEKLSYVKILPAWGWVVGTGVYVSDVRHEMWMESKNMAITMLGVALGGLLLMFLTARVIVGSIHAGIVNFCGFLNPWQSTIFGLVAKSMEKMKWPMPVTI